MDKIKVGIFGLIRGRAFVKGIDQIGDAEVVAVCDKNHETLAEIRKEYGDAFLYCTTFDELLDSDIDCVFLCNFFHEHALYAVRAFERGIAVFSECTAAPTLKDCAELCDAYEKFGAKYMLGENYPFTAPMLEIEKKCREGKFGRILYAEGEYNHTGMYQTLKSLTPEKHHWRAYLPRTYYSTHSIGPLKSAMCRVEYTDVTVSDKPCAPLPQEGN